jgi:16S rRNA processing protein RimM
MDDTFFEVGVITGAMGIGGEVKVYPTTDDPRRFDELTEVYIDTGNFMSPYAIERVRYQKNLVVLKLTGADDREAAEKLKGLTLRIPPDQALPLGHNQFYHRDLLNMRVIEENGEELGVLTHILETGANDVYVVRSGRKDILIPAIKQCIIGVDTESRVMTVKLIPGLKDL